MDARIEQRRKDFKKTFEDPRRRREEQQVQIRKDKREERFSKRRQQVIEDEDGVLGVGVEGTVGGTPSMLQQQQQAVSMDVRAAVNHAVTQLHSQLAEEVVQGAYALRRLLSVQTRPPIHEVIQSGAVPRLLQLLDDDSAPTVQFDAAWALTNIASGDTEQTRVVANVGAIPVFARLLRSSPAPDVREQSAWALGNIAGDCPELRNEVLKHNVLEPIIGELRNAMEDSSKSSVMVNCCWALSNFCRGKPRPPVDVVTTTLPVLRDIVLMPELPAEVLADACWALSYITDGNDAQHAIDQVIATGVAPRLVVLLSHPNQAVQTPALRVVGNIVSGSESQTQAMLNAGCVSALKPLLSVPRKVIRKEACWTISNITAGTHSQIQEVIKGGLIRDILMMLPAADSEIRMEAWWALANAASGASNQQARDLMDMGVMSELVRILENEKVEPKLLCVVLEALSNIFAIGKALNEKDNPYVVLFEEARGTNPLEKLQYLPDGNKARESAVKIIRTYMQFEECNDTTFRDYTTPSNEQAAPAATTGFDFSKFSMQ